MVGLVTLVGILILIAGVGYTVKPAMAKKVIRFWSRGNRIYIASVINIILGIVFLRLASLCYMPWFVTIMGVLGLIKGVAIFALGKKRILDFMEAVAKTPVKTIRALGIVAIALGICLIYAV
jgi:uncharacterized protein YjeT (DUF2065 family)